MDTFSRTCVAAPYGDSLIAGQTTACVRGKRTSSSTSRVNSAVNSSKGTLTHLTGRIARECAGLGDRRDQRHVKIMPVQSVLVTRISRTARAMCVNQQHRCAGSRVPSRIAFQKKGSRGVHGTPATYPQSTSLPRLCLPRPALPCIHIKRPPWNPHGSQPAPTAHALDPACA